MEVFERVTAERSGSGVLLSCEHASDRFWPSFELPSADHWLSGSHWTFDLGAAALCRDIASALGAPAILSNYSRLIIDPNRSLDRDDLFRDHAEGRPIRFNRAVDARERQARIDTFYQPYHRALAELATDQRCKIVFSIHTFTPEYEGERREVEVGILYDSCAELGESYTQALREAGFDARANEPYTGASGLMYAAEHHALNNDKLSLELEFRQDLAVDPTQRARLCAALLPLLGAF